MLECVPTIFLRTVPFVQVTTDYPNLVSDFVKRVCICYVQHYFNPRYNRTGSLFQPRFISEIPSEAGGAANMNRFVYYDSDNNFTKAGSLNSFDETIEQLSVGNKGFLNTECFNGMSRDEYIDFIKVTDPIYLAKLAYTPGKRVLRAYIDRVKKIKALPQADQIRVVKYLYKNRVKLNLIEKITGISRFTLKKLLL